MAKRRFLITGCGRSGTGYTASLLNRLGVECGHEVLYEVERLAADRAPGWPADCPGESSWLAVPFLETLPAGTVVLHQVRHPLAVVRSFVRQNFFGRKHAWRSFAVRHCPALGGDDALENTFRYWAHWNRRVERAGELAGLEYLRYRLEDVDRELVARLLERVGHPRSPDEIAAALEETSSTTNTAGDRTGDSLSWDALTDPSLAREVLALAARYGYDAERLASNAA